MCLAVPGKIISVDGAIAQVDIQGNLVEADVSIVDGAEVGDYVIVHAGLAIQKYDEEEALKTLELFRELGEAMG